MIPTDLRSTPAGPGLNQMELATLYYVNSHWQLRLQMKALLHLIQ